MAGLCAGVRAQAPAGPMTQTSAPPPSTSTATSGQTQTAPNVERTRNLTGSWKLNKDESTQPRDRDRSGRGGGGRSGGGYPGGGRGGMHRGGMSDDERKGMQELMRPSETLDFKQDGAAIVMADDLERHRTFYTDGRKVKKSKDENNQEFDATWQEYRMTADFKGPDGNKIERSFEVLEGNQQLRETVHFTVGRNQREVYLRYVYDLKSGGNSGAK